MSNNMDNELINKVTKALEVLSLKHEFPKLILYFDGSGSIVANRGYHDYSPDRTFSVVDFSNINELGQCCDEILSTSISFKEDTITLAHLESLFKELCKQYQTNYIELRLSIETFAEGSLVLHENFGSSKETTLFDFDSVEDLRLKLENLLSNIYLNKLKGL